jgi:hypothetical protein
VITTITSNNFNNKKEFPCHKTYLQQIINILITIINSKTNKEITVCCPHTSLASSNNTSRAGNNTGGWEQLDGEQMAHTPGGAGGTRQGRSSGSALARGGAVATRSLVEE